MATFAEIQGLVKRDLQRVGASTTVDSDVKTWINQAIREDICLEYNWPFMFSEVTDPTVASQEDYTPSTASTRLKEIFWIRFREDSSDEWVELEELPLRSLLMQWGEQTESRPSAWAMVDHDTVRLRPIPDDAYSLAFALALFPAELSADSDTNFLTVYKPRLVEYATVRRGVLYFGLLERFQFWDGLYREEMAKAIRYDRLAASRAFTVLNQSMAAGMPAPAMRATRPVASRAPYDW